MWSKNETRKNFRLVRAQVVVFHVHLIHVQRAACGNAHIAHDVLNQMLVVIKSRKLVDALHFLNDLSTGTNGHLLADRPGDDEFACTCAVEHAETERVRTAEQAGLFRAEKAKARTVAVHLRKKEVR